MLRASSTLGLVRLYPSLKLRRTHPKSQYWWLVDTYACRLPGTKDGHPPTLMSCLNCPRPCITHLPHMCVAVPNYQLTSSTCQGAQLPCHKPGCHHQRHNDPSGCDNSSRTNTRGFCMSPPSQPSPPWPWPSTAAGQAHASKPSSSAIPPKGACDMTAPGD